MMWIYPAMLVFVGLFFVAAFRFLPPPGTRIAPPAPRCKQWVPLSYIDEHASTTYHSAQDTTPHARCCLPAGHQPRSVHLVDPAEIKELHLMRAPF